MSLADLAHLVETPDWMLKAACRHVDSSIFFPGNAGGDHAGTKARRICLTCPVTGECLDYALSFSSNYDFGIYAGTNAKTRRAMRRERRVA